VTELPGEQDVAEDLLDEDPLAEQLPADEQPTAVPAVPPASAPAREQLTCPECGTAALVTVNRRDSADFCRTCDFPLFWTPAAVLLEGANRPAGESLRRLPGTVGRATVAALPCPTCAEPNALSALVCVRCGGPMHIQAPPPPPEPAYLPPAPVVPEPEPEKAVPWWGWLLLGLLAVTLIVLAVLGGTGHLY
jgi:hypothetical protein